MSTNATNRTKCEVWTRAMGYCRPVQNFNKGKKSEFKERKFFTEKKTVDGAERLVSVSESVKIAA